jgi:hypothetical protein
MARPRRSPTLAAAFTLYLSAEASERLRLKSREAGLSPGAFVERLLGDPPLDDLALVALDPSLDDRADRGVAGLGLLGQPSRSGGPEVGLETDEGLGVPAAVDHPNRVAHIAVFAQYLGNHCAVCKAKKGSDAWKESCPGNERMNP